MRKYRQYSDNDIIKYAKEVFSISGLLKKLGLKVAGGNYINIKRNLQRLNIDCDHWTGQAWNKNQRLKDWSKYTKVVCLKPHLINERGHRCEKCHRKYWFNKLVPLEIHHIDGDRTNNKKENLKLFCCNCHSLTKSWRGKTNSGRDGMADVSETVLSTG